jgi:hypothetical protein
MKIIYEIVEHDGGWAYKVGDVLSETFPSHQDARAAAEKAAAEQELSGETTDIEYETKDGVWREETAEGDDRPETEIQERRPM